MRHASLFSGIGGFDLAADWMGWENVFHCDINPFGKKVLEYYYPKSISYGDITKTDFTIHRGDIDVLSGGFPCQPYSLAGKRKGKEDERHLWPEMLRAIKEIQPRWIIGENVYGLVNWDGGLVFHEVQSDLEAEGYEVFPYVLPACAINAPHRRDRVFFVAYSNSIGCRRKSEESGSNISEERKMDKNIRFDRNGIRSEANGCSTSSSDSESERFESFETRSAEFQSSERQRLYGRGSNRQSRWWENFPTVSPICDGNDGISDRLDSITFSKWRKQSIMAGGNAVVPQLIYVLFKTISKFEQIKNNL